MTHVGYLVLSRLPRCPAGLCSIMQACLCLQASQAHPIILSGPNSLGILKTLRPEKETL